ncbi:clathrin interactor epsin [Anaeramoeba flamelloides]|uniref:Clathrin interactor epsin n=1 Tax=Anaeramoeba flamelloides TaxID=1746091 RepID=A0ABQ8XA25_9EUKA|nr:clathrin interactor epsin [Anaeramoeba flamelloides]
MYNHKYKDININMETQYEYKDKHKDINMYTANPKTIAINILKFKSINLINAFIKTGELSLMQIITNQSNLLRDIEKKVRLATKNKGKEMKTKTFKDLVQLANENQETAIVLKVLWVRLFRSRKKYISIYRALLVIEYFLLNGQDTLISQIEYFKPKVKKLRSFKSARWKNDRGLIVRNKAEKIWKLLTDHSLLRELRDEMKVKKQKTSKKVRTPRSSKSRKNRKKKRCYSDCITPRSIVSSKKKGKQIKYSEDENYYIETSSSSGESNVLMFEKRESSRKMKRKKKKKNKKKNKILNIFKK